MRHLISVVVIFSLLVVMDKTNAQGPATLQCGDVIEGNFQEDRVNHTYVIQANAGEQIIVYTEVSQRLTDLNVDIGMWAPNGFEVDALDARDAEEFQLVETGIISDSGQYTIMIRSNTSTGGIYNLYISCVKADGMVISAGNFVTGIVCGSIVTNTFSRDRVNHSYFIKLNEEDRLNIVTEVLRPSFTDLKVDIGLFTLDGFAIDELDARDAEQSQTLNTETLPGSGVYRIFVRSNTTNRGEYSIFIGCTLRDGTVINPGDEAPINLTEQESSISPDAPITNFSGYGFPGVAPVDFSSGIEIPLQSGQAQTAPIGGDVALYTYDASADEVRSFSITRLSGNISIGVTVILRDTNEIIFFGGMPSSDNLSVDLMFPSDGTYIIGLFRVDTAERSGTSGAVQIMLE